MAIKQNDDVKRDNNNRSSVFSSLAFQISR